MATLAEFYELRYNRPTLRNRVAAAVMVTAWTVAGEGSGQTKRYQWAVSALADPVAQMARAMPAILANTAIRTAELATPDSSTDADIQGVVDGLVDTLAGI